ncbi:asparagine synthase (glutamine-hydrolyzing) [Polynucleobacter sp. MWH-Jannik1A5]|uniref:asparagine synthase (glutamine-hydrolyzing) n=1 Tax=Polynucleobacter sp. MWH-Jannik1A5 TaxID=1855890 RepID=UPI001C0B971F|nr:asparagine synthase (glutamine-hydrolyzing) [Polynucleobacter sp. MWH-Jannik1A5]MBU3546732.1 asparagine synthase (glutamine-hydrolyzing) [Polynucleobacter sp. MWH-Jannik1A5]
MCSIIGVYATGANKIGIDQHRFLSDGFKAMRHRGPDGEGSIVIDDKVILGHQRLAILDISEAGSQPMFNQNSALIFNGEIYNYQEIRETYFHSQKYEFKSESDTEVLKYFLDHFGIGELSKLNGMFSFGYYNKSEKKLFLVRDRLGVKPLYFTEVDGYIYFSSEITPLYSVVKSIKLNDVAIKAYFDDTATDYNSETLIQSIYQVGAGEYIVIDGDGFKKTSWYILPSSEKAPDKSKIVGDYEDLLVDAIRIRLRADVPVCMTLSGGVDSSTIYTLIKERLGLPVAVFTFDHPGAATSELDRVMALTSKYGDSCTVITDDLDLQGLTIDDLSDDLSCTEYPIWSFSTRAYRLMYEAIAKKGYKVVIEGHGADEVLGGYTYLIREAIIDSIESMNLHEAYKLIRIIYSTGHEEQTTSMQKWRFMLSCILNAFRLRGIRVGFKPAIHEAIQYKILPIVLRAFDRLSMRYSIESRAPFLDYRVVEFGLSLGPNQLVNPIGNKAILREILKKYNNSFIYEYKAKHGFSSDLPSLVGSEVIRRALSNLIRDSHVLQNYPLRVSGGIEYFRKKVNGEEGLFEPSKSALIAIFEKNITKGAEKFE